MGHGVGHGGGKGQGHGAGKGQGHGQDTAENVAIGSAVACGLSVIMCVFGIPMIIAGAVLVTLFRLNSQLRTIGLALLGVSGALVVVGLILVVLICTGVCGGKSRVVQQQSVPSQVVVHSATGVHVNNDPRASVSAYPQPLAVPGPHQPPPAYNMMAPVEEPMHVSGGYSYPSAPPLNY